VVRQLSFDYAGHLVAVADNHIALVTMPTAENASVIPAKTALADATEPDPETALENVPTEATLDINAPMFDVLGRQVDKTYRGIVIQNGQAFLIIR
jgi:hypothetical protein